MRITALFLLFALALSVAAPVAADDKKSADLNFTVLRDENGKPIRNASVILHPVSKKGKQEASGVQLKTDTEGKTSYPGVPYGKIRVQVIAPGFQTYGQDLEIAEPTRDVVIKMQRPKDQYSIYK